MCGSAATFSSYSYINTPAPLLLRRVTFAVQFRATGSYNCPFSRFPSSCTCLFLLYVYLYGILAGQFRPATACGAGRFAFSRAAKKLGSIATPGCPAASVVRTSSAAHGTLLSLQRGGTPELNPLE